MKKLFILLAISSLSFVSCGNSGSGEPAEDSTGSTDTSVVDPSLGNPPVNPADTMVNLDTTSVADTSAGGTIKL